MSARLPLTILVGSLVASGCPLSAPDKPSHEQSSLDATRSVVVGPTTTLQLLATADVGADTDVCGCEVKKLGGLVRRSALVKRRRASFEGPTFVVDAGDLFFRRWSLPPRYRAQARRTATLHADALAEWRATAMAVGERDLALGVSELRRLSRRAGIEALSANLVFVGSGTTAFSSYVVVNAGDIKVGFVGVSPVLTTDDPAHVVYEQAGLRALDEGPALRAAARQARAEGAVWVVGLMHVGQPRAEAILAGLPPQTIDFAVVGHDRDVRGLKLVDENRRAYAMAGERGKWLLGIRATVVPGATRTFDGSAVFDEVLKQLELRIATTSDPAKRARLERRRDRMRTEAARVAAQVGHRIGVDVLALDPALDEDPAMVAAYRQYQSDLAALADVDVEPAELKYVGHEACRGCHESAYQQWSTTGHASAWKTMERTGQTANLDCIGCHVTGFERAGGPRRLADLQPFRNVGCEACHGPASAHAETPERPPDYGRSVPESVCAECHRAQGDQRPFVYSTRLLKVLGPGHGQASTDGP